MGFKCLKKPHNTAINGLTASLLVSSAMADEDDFGYWHDLPQFASLLRVMQTLPQERKSRKNGKSEQDKAYLDTQK